MGARALHAPATPRTTGDCASLIDHELLVVRYPSLGLNWVACWFCGFRAWVREGTFIDRAEAIGLIRQGLGRRRTRGST